MLFARARRSLETGFLYFSLGLLSAFLSAARGQVVVQTGAGAGAAADVSQYPERDDQLPGKGPMQKWADFPKIWAQRHAEWRAQAARDHGAVVFLGDSITQGWSTLAGDFPGLKVANRGIGGDTTRGVLYRLQADVLDLEPAAVVLLIGTNDLGLGADPADIVDNIKAILTAIRKANAKTPVILCKVMPSSDKQQRPAVKIKALNALLERLARGDSAVTLCDTWSLYAGADGDSKPEEFPDRLHPNRTGYEKWAAALKPVFERLKLASSPVR